MFLYRYSLLSKPSVVIWNSFSNLQHHLQKWVSAVYIVVRTCWSREDNTQIKPYTNAIVLVTYVTETVTDRSQPQFPRHRYSERNVVHVPQLLLQRVAVGSRNRSVESCKYTTYCVYLQSTNTLQCGWDLPSTTVFFHPALLLTKLLRMNKLTVSKSLCITFC